MDHWFKDTLKLALAVLNPNSELNLQSVLVSFDPVSLSKDTEFMGY
jgi:hypothetical protein